MEYASLIGAGIQLPFNMAETIAQLQRNGKSDEELQRAIKEAYGIEIPSEKLMEIRAQQIAQEPDSVADPAARGAQMEALRKLSGVASAGGMDPGSIAALRQAEETGQKQLRDSSASLMRQQMSKGILDSGSTTANNLALAQSSSNMTNKSGIQAAGDARMRALQAISSLGSLGSRVRADDQSQFDANREARMKIGMFNADAAQAAQQATARNMLARTGAQTARAGAIGNAANSYNNAGQDRYKKLRQLGQDISNPLQVADKLGVGR